MTTPIAITMGSKSDWKYLEESQQTLQLLGIKADVFIVSAHRTPDRLYQFATNAEAKGYRAIISGAGGAAHLPGMIASITIIPVIGVPIPSTHLNGVDSLLSICQMPAGIPVATMSIGRSGAVNAALYAAAMLATTDPQIATALKQYKENQTNSVALTPFE